MSEPFRFHPVPVPEAAPVRWLSRASGRVTGPGVRWLLVLGIGLLHGLAIWALQAGLGVRTVEAVVPVQVLADLLDNAPSPPPPASPPSASPAPAHAVPPAPVARPVKPMPTPAPVQPPTAALPEPAAAITAVAAPAAVAPAPDPAPAAPVAASPVPAVPAIEKPSSDAAYLRNPPPAYPPQSVRLGEQGQVVLRVFIEADGRASQAEILHSSGFERLDQVALQTVRRWRYVPGKRAGVPEAMWTTVPLSFVLD